MSFRREEDGGYGEGQGGSSASIFPESVWEVGKFKQSLKKMGGVRRRKRRGTRGRAFKFEMQRERLVMGGCDGT